MEPTLSQIKDLLEHRVSDFGWHQRTYYAPYGEWEGDTDHHYFFVGDMTLGLHRLRYVEIFQCCLDNSYVWRTTVTSYRRNGMRKWIDFETGYGELGILLKDVWWLMARDEMFDYIKADLPSER